MRSAGALLAVLLLAGCASTADSQTFRAGDVTVVDESGLVTGAEAQDPPIPPPAEPTVARGDSLTRVVVSWSGNTCIEDWTLRLEGTNAVDFVIEPGASPAGCEGMEAGRSVLVQLNRATDADSIEVTLRDGS